MHILWIFILALSADAGWARTLNVVSGDFPVLTLPPKQGPGQGVLIDVTRSALAKMGHDMTYTSFPWKRALQKVETGEADIVLGTYKNRDREKVYLFPRFANYRDVISVFTPNNSLIKWDGDLAKAACPSLGIMLGWSYGNKLDEWLRHRTVESMMDERKGMFLLAKNRLDCFLVSNDVAEKVLDHFDERDQIRQLTPPAAFLDVYIAFSRKTVDQKFLGSFEKALLDLEKDGSLRSIFKTYNREPVTLRPAG